MKLKIILALILVLLVVGAAVVDAKGKSGGGKSSKSISTASKSTYQKAAASAAPIVAATALGSTGKKKSKLDLDDALENETAEDLQTAQTPGLGLLPAALAFSIVLGLRIRRCR